MEEKIINQQNRLLINVFPHGLAQLRFHSETYTIIFTGK